MRKEYFSTGFLSRCSSQGILSSFLANSILENTEKKQCLTFRDNKKMHMLIQQIACEFFDRGIASQEIIGAYMIILFSEMLKTRCNVIVNQKEGSEIIKMLKYIEKNYSEINLEKMADEFSFNSTYLSSYLKKYTGHTFKELVIFQRMFSANFYLLNSDLPIYEIAQKVGYNNLGFFYKRFQSIYGLTPQEYRNKNNISVI